MATMLARARTAKATRSPRLAGALALLAGAALAMPARAANPAALTLSASFQGVAVITNVAASSQTAIPTTQLLVQWTAPLTQGTTAPLAYDMRVSSTGNMQTTADFNAAKLLSAFSQTSTPTVLSGGTPQSLVVAGLQPGTTYCFALRALDSGTPPAKGAWLRSAAKGFNLLNCAVTAPFPPLNPVIVAVNLSSMTVDFSTNGALGYYEVDASTAADFTGMLYSSATRTQAAALAPQGLSPNTTYFMRAGALVGQTTVYAFTTPLSSSTLALPPLNGMVAAMTPVAVTVNWSAMALSPSSMSAEGYLLQASTAPDFTGTLLSSATAGVSLSTLTVAGLSVDTTYYFRVASLNWNSNPDFAFVGSTYTAAAPINPTIVAASTSSITVAYGTIGALGYEVDASTAADFSGVIHSSATSNQAAVLAPQGLNPNTTYYLRAGALWGQTTYYAYATPRSTSTWSLAPLNAAVADVFFTSVTVNWSAMALSPSSMSAEGYLVQASTRSNFSGTIYSTATSGVSLSTLTVMNLIPNATYYFRVASLNWDSVPDFSLAGSTFIAAPAPLNPAIVSAYLSSATVSYGLVSLGATSPLGYVVDASTAADFSGRIVSSATPSLRLTTLAPQGLYPNTTYYMRAGALWGQSTFYAYTTPRSTSTLALPPLNAMLVGVTTATITVNWTALASTDPTKPPPTLIDVSSMSAEGYILQASRDPSFPNTNQGEGQVFSAFTNDVTLSTLTVAVQWPGKTYYLRVGSLNWEGVYDFGPVTLSTQTWAKNPPQTPYGMDIALTQPSALHAAAAKSGLAPMGGAGTCKATITWLPVVRFADTTPFKIATAPVPSELSAYQVFLASAPTEATWNLLGTVSTSTLVYQDTWTCVTGDMSEASRFYQVQAVNKTAPSIPSMVRSADKTNAYVVSPDLASYIQIPQAYLDSFNKGTVDTAFLPIVSSETADTANNVLAGADFSLLHGGVVTDDIALSGQATVKLSYPADAPADNMSVFWWNGIRWLQLYGKADAANHRITVNTVNFGKYEVRSVPRSAGFSCDASGASNRYITPNGDGRNDGIIFYYNPGQGATPVVPRIKIFDARGRLVRSDLPAGPTANSVIWDGMAGGRAVPMGVYIYQLQGEGKTCTGTVIVIK